MTSNAAVFSLFRALTREAKRINDYNFRSHAIRRVRKGFEINRGLQGEGSINTALEGGKQDLALLRRQASIGQMYPGDRSVMEN